jgi:hypothetical protein
MDPKRRQPGAAGKGEVVLLEGLHGGQRRELEQRLPSSLHSSSGFGAQELLEEVGVAHFVGRGRLCKRGPLSRQPIEL